MDWGRRVEVWFGVQVLEVQVLWRGSLAFLSMCFSFVPRLVNEPAPIVRASLGCTRTCQHKKTCRAVSASGTRTADCRSLVKTENPTGFCHQIPNPVSRNFYGFMGLWLKDFGSIHPRPSNPRGSSLPKLNPLVHSCAPCARPLVIVGPSGVGKGTLMLGPGKSTMLQGFVPKLLALPSLWRLWGMASWVSAAMRAQL